MWDSGWDNLFKRKEWGKYPPEELVRFVGRNYYGVADRRKIRFLDLGCGPGANLWYLAREGFQVDGVDGSAVALAQAKQRLSMENLRAGLHHCDVAKLDFEEATFDCIIDIECVYANSLSDSRKIIAEAHLALKPGGLMFSKTFATGTSGDGTGRRVEGEPNTYLELEDSPLHSEYGLIRFTAEKEIADLYSVFPHVAYDYVERSDRNGRYVIREWLITCRKSSES